MSDFRARSVRFETLALELESATHRPAIQKSGTPRAGTDWTVEANSPNPANSANTLAPFGGVQGEGAMVPAFMSLLQAVADVAPALEKLTAQSEKRGETPVEAKLLLTLDEAHSLTGLSRATLKGAIDGGQLKARIVGRAWRIKRRDLDSFIEAMVSINEEAQTNPELVIGAPHTTRIGRLDEATAARKPVLRWKPDMEATAKTA